MKRKTGLRRGPRRGWNSTLRAKSPKTKGHRFPKMVDEAYRTWIRERLCAVAGPNYGPGQRYCDFWPWRPGMECAHLKTRGSGGEDGGNIVPLCPAHHEEQEGRTAEFEARYGVDLSAIAADLWVRYREETGNE